MNVVHVVSLLFSSSDLDLDAAALYLFIVMDKIQQQRWYLDNRLI